MSQSSLVKKKPRAKDLSCILADLVSKYSGLGLKSCETKASQVWRHASSKEAAKQLALYHVFIPELAGLHTSLSSYSICERHYNQLISINNFHQQLLDDPTLAH